MKEYIKDILKKRKQLSVNEHKDFSNKICQSIKRLEEYIAAKNILIFYPYLNEVDVLSIAKEALKEEKNVFFPKVTDSTSMDFIKVMDLEDFKEGYKGIWEPVGKEVFSKNTISQPTLMILPGSAFDFCGNRTGYGKGYYDRYLEQCYDKITKIGVCFSLQILAQIPDVKVTDIPMDYVICEKMVRSIKTNGNVK